MDSNEREGTDGVPPLGPPRLTARQRQRRGPMWGRLRGCGIAAGLFVIVLALIGFALYWYIGTGSFEDLVRLRIEKTLESRLQRHVTIAHVEIRRGSPQRVVLRDIRIANSPGAVNPYFATVGELEITGGLTSFWGRNIKVQRIDIRDPHLWFEVYPAGAPLVHNFPKWQSGPQSRFEIVHLQLGTMFVNGGAFDFLDRKHDIAANANGITSELQVSNAKDVYSGLLASRQLRVRIQQFVPFDVTMHGGFRYSPNVLALNNIALSGRNMQLFLKGNIAPLSDAAYDLHLTAQVGLDRVREIFQVTKTLEGLLSFDGSMRGKAGDFRIAGGFVAPRIKADVYELTAPKGTVDVTGERTLLDVQSAHYGGGTIGAHYVLPTYAEPYPMSVDLSYDRISLEKLFSDWGVKDTGLRGAATGKLAYHWNKDKVLEGSGQGRATLARNATAFSNARYPLPLTGATDFALDNGVIRFSNANLATDVTRIAFGGTLRIEDLSTDLSMKIDSSDFSELDRIGYNFAHSAGKNTYELLGLGGTGQITGTVAGPLKTPRVAARISSSGTKYNNVLLGDGDLTLQYDGVKSVLAFDHSTFRDGDATMLLSGNIAFPASGPSPRFDLAIEATNYPLDRALKVVNLDLPISGAGSGRLVVTGTPENGKVTFANLHIRDGAASADLNGDVAWLPGKGNTRFNLDVDAHDYPVERAMEIVKLKLGIGGIGNGKLHISGSGDDGTVTFNNLIVRQPGSELRLNGDVAWLPGKGNLRFNLDVGARDFPVQQVAKFFDFESLPVTGLMNGTLHLEGTKAALGGGGSITVRNGTLYGEPITSVSTDLTFSSGKLKLGNVVVTAPAGTIKGAAELDLATNAFNYTIESTALDLSKLTLLQSMAGLLGGNLTISSTGAGTTTQPELVLTATLNNATIRGLALPAGMPAPTIYLAIRNGQLIVKGSAGDILTIDGQGAVAADGALSGNVRIAVTDFGRLLALSPSTASLPASGKLVVDLQLGGKITSLETLRIDATFPTFDLRLSEHEFTASSPLHLALHDGRLFFESFQLQRTGSMFTVAGSVELTGEKRIDLDMHGEVEAALAQLFVHDLKADGHLNVAATIRGTLSDPRVTGSAEVQDAQVKFPGFPQTIDHITGTLVFRGDRIEIDSLRANVGGGSVVAGGYVSIEGITPKSARLTLQGTEVAIRYFEGLTIDANFSLLLSGDIERFVLSGDVRVNRALYYKDFDFSTSLLNVILSRRGVTPVVSASWQDKVGLRLHLLAPGTLAVRNNIADATASADIDVNGTLANPVVLGLVSIDEGGRLRFQNTDYHVSRGTINFQNPFRIDPYFDITMEGRISGNASDLDSGPLDVTVNITGTLDRLTPTISSDPPTSDITLFSLLGVGGLTGNRTPGAQTPDAALAGRSLLYQSIGNIIGSKILPFADSFSYDPGLLDTSATPGPKVTFEKRVSTDVRVIVVYNTRDQKTREVIEWQATPDWILQFTRDEPRSEYRIEARFRRRYRGHWVFGHFGRRTTGQLAALHGASNGAAGGATSGATSGAVTDTVPASTETTPAAPPNANAPIVATINFRSDAPFDTAVLTQYITLRAGQPLAIRATQNSIQSLFATGDFRDIRVETTTGARGVNVTFVLSVNYRVGAITFDGLHGSDRSRATRELTIHTGDVFSLNAVDHSAVAVQEVTTQLGYLESSVDPETQFNRAQSRADVILHVTPGPLAKIAAIDLQGKLEPFTAEMLIKQMTRRPGAVFRLADARSDADRIRRFLLRKNYRKAVVRYVSYAYDKVAKTVTIRYEVNVGPTVKVEVEGVPRRAVRGLIPFRANQPYSEDVIDRAADDILDAYQQRGYFNAVVDTEGQERDGVWTSTFHIVPGQRFRLERVTFSGNQKISDKELAGVIATSPTGGIRSLLATVLRRATGVTRRQLSADRDSLESYYRLKAFTGVTVGTPVVTTTPDGKLFVDFPINEGTQTLLANVHVEGNEQVKSEELPKPQLKAGDPLNPQLEREDVVALQTFYAARGNAEVQIVPREVVTPDKSSASVSYVVAEGPRIKVGDVVVRGNDYTKTSVILRKAELKPGQPFSYTSILEAQRNLYRLGIFQRVDVQPEQAGTSVGDRNVVIQVEEGKDLTISGSAGITSGIDRADNSIAPRASLSVAQRNLFGTGRYLGLELIYSNKENEAFLTYREPFIFNYNIPVQLTVFQTDDQTRAATHIRQRGTFIEASKVARFQTQWSLRYEYKISECIEESPTDVCALSKGDNPIPGLDRSLQNIKISSVTPTFFWDRRDDSIDPHRGFFTSASVEYAFKLFAADTHFVKEFAQGSWYLPVSARSTFAVSGRLGLIQPIGAAGSNSRVIPLSERFTAGGESSHRAYALDMLGTLCEDPTDTTCKPTLIRLPNSSTVAPIGGNGEFLANIEYRFPIVSALGAAVFTDAGNVYRDSTIDLHDLRYGVGAGIRYLSPVGPIRFDLGYKLNRRYYEPRFAFSFSLGSTF